MKRQPSEWEKIIANEATDKQRTKVNQREEDKSISSTGKNFTSIRNNSFKTHTQILEFKHKQAIPPSLRDKFGGEDKQIHRNLYL